MTLPLGNGGGKMTEQGGEGGRVEADIAADVGV